MVAIKSIVHAGGSLVPRIPCRSSSPPVFDRLHMQYGGRRRGRSGHTHADRQMVDILGAVPNEGY